MFDGLVRTLQGTRHIALHLIQLRIAMDGGQRGAQLMAGVGDEAHLGAVGLVDAVQHGVDGLGQGFQLLLGAGQVDAPVQMGGVDLVQLARQAFSSSGDMRSTWLSLAAVAASSWMGRSTFLMEPAFLNRLVTRLANWQMNNTRAAKTKMGCGLGRRSSPDGVGLVPRHLELSYLFAKQLKPRQMFPILTQPPLITVSGSPHKFPTDIILAQLMRPSQANSNPCPLILI